MDRPQPSLPAAARALARAGGLDARLDALVSHVVEWGGAGAAIHLYDPVSEQLVVAASAGTHSAGEAEGTLPLSDASPAAVAARERRVVDEGDVLALPLVSADPSGSEQAEGALVIRLGAGVRPDPTSRQGLEALADFCAMAIRQARLEAALADQADWIGRLATTDPLTGLANRATFEQMLEVEIARAARLQSEISVLVFDVVALAEIDRRAGGATGDDVLRQVAAALAGGVRIVDAVARVGGDEFGVIAPGGGGRIVGDRLIAAVAQLEALPGEPIRLRYGLAVYPHDASKSTELVVAAERALAAQRTDG
ncbi:MAG TPA: sensor domain-containing diguanylate cyclase [Candidatus Limnocylindria bacterium]|nr:sensor domain-containing diguanylate cyclase [Candidatus Limnocylindria bacterium]